MGFRSDRRAWVVRIALAATAVGLLLPAYAKLAAWLAGRGLELSGFGHLALFALLHLVGLSAVVLAEVCLRGAWWAIGRVFLRSNDAV